MGFRDYADLQILLLSGDRRLSQDHPVRLNEVLAQYGIEATFFSDRLIDLAMGRQVVAHVNVPGPDILARPKGVGIYEEAGVYLTVKKGYGKAVNWQEVGEKLSSVI